MKPEFDKNILRGVFDIDGHCDAAAKYFRRLRTSWNKDDVAHALKIMSNLDSTVAGIKKKNGDRAISSKKRYLGS
ncbi:hypothetical protein [Candidatus Sneabacter namystus]|uniref:Uncharacterized protein n=1 Tax=Candidatus Sneabacter namystus TaxID=2601646 RepID=A0A5C0UJM8_9RICK|nr:hypothetical protein [Candidatus Sneabacter namystus]QEK39723.1 hypothetical protein FZC37_02165 [Candidatus Sneabacter namystus]